MTSPTTPERPGHAFTDPVSRRVCTLHVAKGWMGVEHPDCDQPADVAPALDSFYCSTCGWNGRIQGWWASDTYAAAQRGEAPDA